MELLTQFPELFNFNIVVFGHEKRQYVLYILYWKGVFHTLTLFRSQGDDPTTMLDHH